MALLAWLPLAVDREVAIVAALATLAVAALTVSVGAWVLLARELRLDRTPVVDQPADPSLEEPQEDPATT